MRFLFTSTAVWLIIASLIALSEPTWNITASAHGQTQRISALPKVHYLQDADSAPGVVGQGRLLRGGQVAGFFQPVEVSGPEKLEVAFGLNRVSSSIHWRRQSKSACWSDQSIACELPTYRCVPVKNYIQRSRFSIDCTLHADESIAFRFQSYSRKKICVRALDGAMITRVIYLEDSENALPQADEPGSQRVTDVSGNDNALKVADQLGRPMAILRIGSRVPTDLRG